MAQISDFSEQAKALAGQMTPEEKASLTSGQDFWRTKEIRRFSIPSIRMADGPHGVRRQTEQSDALGVHESLPATCFPTASILSCSFDQDLVRDVGRAIGEEALSQEVSIVLGPGANQKRSPLCGRNFEYFSEDPLLTGKLAAAMIQGIQDTGAGACLKHFAVNNQEKFRMTINVSLDERTLHETYLSGFEYAVKEGKPWMVMSAYNKINGAYCSENKLLLTDILRKDWGFQGAVVTDWGANNDRIAGINAGQDLEMPGCLFHDKEVAAAARLTHLNEDALDASAARMAAIALTAAANQKERAASGNLPDSDSVSVSDSSPDPTRLTESHHRLAEEAALKSIVLLKNEGGLLPGSPEEKIAIIGGFAKAPRFQGLGSSKINPLRVDTIYELLTARGINFSYAQGYPMKKEDDEAFLLREAAETARGKGKVYLFAGLPGDWESEGFDRSSLILPDSHNVLIRTILKANPHTAVILCGGGPMELPWFDQAPAILFAGLAGQAGAGALVRLLFDGESPSGKLSETWPLSLADTPAALYFPGGNEIVEYRESIYVGYRFYDKAQRPVRFPFGYGLSYTSFSYSNLRLSRNRIAWGEPLTAFVTITNTGSRKGTETVQIYASGNNERVFLPEKQLAGFARVTLEPGEKREAAILLEPRAFAYYNTEIHDWYAAPGTYRVLAGPSCAQTPLRAFVELCHASRPEPDYRLTAPDYFSICQTGPFRISDESFYGLTGFTPRPLSVQKSRPFDLNITLTGSRPVLTGRILCSAAKWICKWKKISDPMALSMVWEMPLRSAFTFSQGALSPRKRDGLLDFLNGKVFRGLWKLLF